MPDAGGKILSLLHLASRFDRLWRNCRLPLFRSYAGAPFGDVWCGGWNDMFPRHRMGGERQASPRPRRPVDRAWEWEIVSDDDDEAAVHLSRLSTSRRARRCRTDIVVTVSTGNDSEASGDQDPWAADARR